MATASDLIFVGLQPGAQLTFTARLCAEWAFAPGVPRGDMLSAGRFSVAIRLPACLRVVPLPPDKSPDAPFVGLPFDAFVTDGTRQCGVSHSSMVFDVAPTSDHVSDLSTRQGLVEWLHLDWLFAASTPGRLRRVRMIADHTAEVELDGVWYGGRTRRIMQFDTHERLPCSIAARIPPLKRLAIVQVRTEYSEWSLDVHLPDSTFDTQPPDGYLWEP